MKTLINLTISFILFLVFLIICHESAHWIINTYYGCTEQTIVFALKGVGILSHCEFSEPQLLAHSINDVVGYILIPIASILFLQLEKIIELLKEFR